MRLKLRTKEKLNILILQDMFQRLTVPQSLWDQVIPHNISVTEFHMKKLEVFQFFLVIIPYIEIYKILSHNEAINLVYR